MNYYNENDPKTAAWLRQLIKENLIAPGDVDERSVTEVRPDDLRGFRQCHFFAGIGGWSYALRLAGWPDDDAVWTGSCPCQPFSAAGKQLGTADERHLWPVFRELIAECRPAITFGEQVASPLGREWLAGVRNDLEGLGYEVGAADLCAAGVGSPHIRQRLYWVAYAEGPRSPQRGSGAIQSKPGAGGGSGGVADSDGGQSGNGGIQRGGQHGQQPENGGAARRMGDAQRAEKERLGQHGGEILSEQETAGLGCASATVFESDYEWPPGVRNHVVYCRDGKYRRFEPGAFPLAHGVSGRVGLLRGYGNAINPWLAAEFIQASIEALTLCK